MNDVNITSQHEVEGAALSAPSAAFNSEAAGAAAFRSSPLPFSLWLLLKPSSSILSLRCVEDSSPAFFES